MDLITVIINVYNGEKYIKKCLDSIVNQTYKNLEILIVNDGSTDNTLKICKGYNDKRIRIISTANKGLSLSRNIGIDNAKGSYLYFVDADDYIEFDTIEYFYSLIKKYNVSMVTSASVDIYNNKYKKNKCNEKIQVLSKEQMLEKNLLSLDNSITMWNKLIDVKLFKNIRFHNRIINDLAVTYKLILLCEKVVFSNQIKYYYVRNDESISIKKKNDINRNVDMYKVAIERFDNIQKIYPNMIANNIGLLRIIAILYNKQSSELHDYLDNNNARQIFKKLFKFKILFYKMNKKDKVIILLCRISPKLSRFIYYKYKKIKCR